MTGADQRERAIWWALSNRLQVDLGDRYILPLTRHGFGLAVYDSGTVQLLDSPELRALPVEGYGPKVDPLVFGVHPLGGSGDRELLEALAVLATHHVPVAIGYQKAGQKEPETRELNNVSWSDGDLFCAFDRGRQAPRTFSTKRVRWVQVSRRSAWIPQWNEHTGAYLLVKRPKEQRA